VSIDFRIIMQGSAIE